MSDVDVYPVAPELGSGWAFAAAGRISDGYDCERCATRAAAEYLATLVCQNPDDHLSAGSAGTEAEKCVCGHERVFHRPRCNCRASLHSYCPCSGFTSAVGPGDDKRGSVGADPSITDVGASPAPEGERVDGSRDKREPDYSVTRPGPASVDAEHEHVYVGTCWCGESAPDVPADGDIGWYISDTHARRAIGYLTGSVPELGRVPIPRLAEAWGEALEKTMDWTERSPIGPEVPRTEGPFSGPETEVRALHGFLQDIAATVGLGPDIESYDDVCKAVERLSTGSAPVELPAWWACVCGHRKDAHIYHEGACRPGSRCSVDCAAFRPQSIPSQKATVSQGCAHAYTEDANGPVCGKCGERG